MVRMKPGRSNDQLYVHSLMLYLVGADNTQVSGANRVLLQLGPLPLSLNEALAPSSPQLKPAK